MDIANVVLDANRDVVVAGAGIIGLSTALELAAAGFQVTVVERATSMSESSWAAAGMLAANDPENPALLGELAALSLRLYPEYLRRIEQLSGARIPFRTHSTLQGSHVGQAFEQGYQSGRPVSPLEAFEPAPHLDMSGREFRVLDEWSLDPRELCAALPISAKAAGVHIVENTSVLSVSTHPDRAHRDRPLEISTNRGKISAHSFVNCAGAWAPTISSTFATEENVSTDSWVLPIRPRKGHILSVRLDAAESPRCVIRTPEIYLVPRGDGLIVIGATVEDEGFSKQVDPEVIRSLMARAAVLWPPISSATIVESWAGIRPGTPDGLPFIGPICGADFAAPHASRQWMATGHFRNGILLAPATALIVSQLVQGLETSIDVAPFGMQRFS